MIKGKVAPLDLAAGQILVDDEFVTPAAAQTSFSTTNVPNGQVAITISVSNVQAVAGLIVPGDKVDLMGTFHTGNPSADAGTDVGEYEHFFYQNVNVIAIGTTAAPTAGNTGAVTNPGSDLFTFAVPPGSRRTDRACLGLEPGLLRARPPVQQSGADRAGAGHRGRQCPRPHPVRPVVPGRNGDVVGTMDQTSTMTGTTPHAFSFAVAIVDDDPRLRTRLGVQVGDIGQAGRSRQSSR